MPVFKLSDLRAKVYGRLDNNTRLYATREVDYVINECIKVTALHTGFYRVTAQLPGFSQANQVLYATPPSILVPRMVFFEGRQLERLKFSKLVRHRRNWATNSTATHGRVDYWSPVGISTFVISPKDAQGGRDMTIVGIGTPPLLVNANDLIPLENEYVDLITEYGEHRLPLKEGGKTFADGSLALNDFYAKLKERKMYEDIKFAKYKLLPQAPEKGAA